MKKKNNAGSKKQKANNYRPPIEFEHVKSDSVVDKRFLELGQDLIGGIENGLYNSLEHFRFVKRIAYTTWKDWCKRSPYMQELNALAKQGLYARRITAGFNKDCDSRLLNDAQLSYLSDDYEKHISWFHSMNNDTLKKLIAENEALRQQLAEHGSRPVVITCTSGKEYNVHIPQHTKDD